MVWGEERSAVASDLWGGERPWRWGQSWMANDSANRAHVEASTPTRAVGFGELVGWWAHQPLGQCRVWGGRRSSASPPLGCS